MKSLFPYVIMAVLFLAGNRLVDRQQQYNSATEVSVSVKPAAFVGTSTTNSGVAKMQLTSEDESGRHKDSRAIKNDQFE